VSNVEIFTNKAVSAVIAKNGYLWLAPPKNPYETQAIYQLQV
jgi:hypothetical protein